MNTDMKRLEMLIADLNKIGIKPFIGYGNPNADILIIDKECAEENTERQEKFYTIVQKKSAKRVLHFGFLPTIIKERWEKYDRIKKFSVLFGTLKYSSYLCSRNNNN